MAEFFIELFSEEIPARMQRAGAQELLRICEAALADLRLSEVQTFYGPRRIALAAQVAAEKPGGVVEARGPRESAPDAAVAGFLGKHKASRDELVIEGGFYVLRRNEAAVSASDLIAAVLPGALAKFSWPKSMRWGQSGIFTWIRPLRRIICLLDGEVIPIILGPVTASNETEGHRFLARGAFTIRSAKDWQEKLRSHYVIVDQEERKKSIRDNLKIEAEKLGLSISEDESLADEVTGLVEWPVVLIGKIDAGFMDLPPEVRELSMKVNQRYFALRDAGGHSAPYFAFVANIEAIDGGAAIIAGNERVLRARLSDARHFWDLDLKTYLSNKPQNIIDRLRPIVFHNRIGSQYERILGLQDISRKVVKCLGGSERDIENVDAAALFCKTDLITGMVGEFPELQGIMGGYYAERKIIEYKQTNDLDPQIVGEAIKTHYQPKGPNDTVPKGIVAVSLALTDKIYMLDKFFRIGEKPTGSGDPYALRRAALGIIRIIVENELSLELKKLVNEEVFAFIIDRLRVKLRSEGRRFDVLDAVLTAGSDDDLVRIMQRVTAVAGFLATDDGSNLLAGYRRAANLLKIEEGKDFAVPGKGDDLDAARDSGLRRNDDVGTHPDETNLAKALDDLTPLVRTEIDQGRFGEAMRQLSGLRNFVDAFFENVTVNDPVPEIRLNRLQLLARLRNTMHEIADFSKIEG